MKKKAVFIIGCLLLCLPQSVLATPTVHVQTLAVDALIVALKATWNSMLEEVVTLEEDNETELAIRKKETAATIQSMARAEALAYGHVQKEQAIVDNALENARQFSPLSQSAYACCSEDLGVGLVQGESRQKEFKHDLYNAVTTYNNNFISTNSLYNQLKPVADNFGVDQAWAIFPLHETIDSEQNAVANIILNSNPMPAVKLTPAALATSMGQHYELLRKIQLSKLAIPQKTLTDIASSHMPAYPLGDWHAQMQSAKGVPPGVSDAVVNGYLSADAILKMQVQSRYGNPNWSMDLHRKFPAGLLRELLEVEAIDLKFQKRLLQLSEQRLAVYAQDSANMLAERYDKQLNQLQSKALILKRNN